METSVIILRKESKSQRLHTSQYEYVNFGTHRTLDIKSKSIKTRIASCGVVVTSER